jgi:acyl-CoA synthetase (NDP forming)
VGQSAAGADLSRLFNPRGVAFIGASRDTTRHNGFALRHAREAGPDVPIYAVNPKYDEVLGLPCYRSLEAVPGPVDVAVSMLAPTRLLEVIRQATGRVGFLVVVSELVAREEADPETRLDELRGLLGGGAPRLIGPSCTGVVLPPKKLSMSISAGLPGGLPRSGGVALISQSGGILGATMDRARVSGVGFSALLSCGGDFDLGVCDYLEALIDDQETRAIGIYAEGLDEPVRFLALADRARDRDKAILLLKPGHTEAGARTALSHSGRIVGNRQIEEAAMRRHGVLMVDDVDDLHITAGLLARYRLPAKSGRHRGAKGLGAASLSGGYAVVLGDAVSEANIPLARLSPATLAALRAVAHQPDPTNPIDAGSSPESSKLAKVVSAVLETLEADDNVEATLYGEMVFLNPEQLVPELSRFIAKSRKPHITCWQVGPLAAAHLARLREAGVMAVDNLDSAIRALASLYAHAELMVSGPFNLPPRLGAYQLEALPRGLLEEAEAFDLLGRFDVPVAKYRVAAAAEDAAAVAGSMGFPVVLKGLVPGCAHKTELGLVVLGLEDADAVEGAAQEMAERVPGVAEFLVQEMVEGLELLVGVKCDPGYGPAVLLGWGGLLVEAMGPPAVELAPLDQVRALAMIEAVDPKGIIQGYRGGQAYDREALALLLMNVGRFAQDLGHGLKELDLNPVKLRHDGIVAVDAVIELA